MQTKMLGRKTLPKMNGLSLFRYSKLCMLQWVGAVAAIVYGCVKGNWIMVGAGLAAWMLMPVLNEMVLNVVSLCQSSVDPAGTMDKIKKLCAAGVVPIVYSPGYNITAGGLEKLHPFDSTKYKRIWDFLF